MSAEDFTSWLMTLSGIRRCSECGKLFRFSSGQKAEITSGSFIRYLCMRCKESTQEDLTRVEADHETEAAISRIVESDESMLVGELRNDINRLIYEYSLFKHWRDVVTQALGPFPEGMGAIEYIRALKAQALATRALAVVQRWEDFPKRGRREEK